MFCEIIRVKPGEIQAIKNQIALQQIDKLLSNVKSFQAAYLIHLAEHNNKYVKFVNNSVEFSGGSGLVHRLLSFLEFLAHQFKYAFDNQLSLKFFVDSDYAGDVHIYLYTDLNMPYEMNNYCHKKTNLHGYTSHQYQEMAEPYLNDFLKTIKINFDITPKSDKYEVWQFAFDSSYQSTYKIPPLVLSTVVDNALFYLNPKFSDFAMVCQNEKLPVHRIVLYQQGGDYFKALLSSNLAEDTNQSLTCTEFRVDNLKLYLKFVYGLDLADCEFNALDLLEIAHYFQHQNFINYLLNVINLVSTFDMIPDLKEFNLKYNNIYLHDIICCL